MNAVQSRVDRVALNQVRLCGRGLAMTLSLAAGQRLAVVGPGASGKSRLLRAIAGQDRLGEGTVQAEGEVFFLEPGTLAPRSKPQAIAKRPQDNSASLSTELLVATRLWDVRTHSISDLSPSQEAAAETLALLSSSADVRLWDGQLDDLDPWTFDSVWGHLEKGSSAGVCDVIATHRPEIVELCDAVIVLSALEVRFAGRVEELLTRVSETEMIVRTEHQGAVRALVSPFQVSVRQHPEGLLIRAAEGQALAARLLAEGYGDVECIVMKPASVGAALRTLIA